AVLGAVLGAEPEVIVHQLTALAGAADFRRFDRTFAQTNRLRTEGLRNLLDAGRAAGAKRLIAQSFTGWPLAREGGPVKDEDAPLDPAPPRAQRASMAAIRDLEATVGAAASTHGVEGVVLRYGGFYGPGTSLGADGDMTALVRRRRLPVVGSGEGLASFTHVDDAAGGVLATLRPGGPTGTFAIVDDEPARAADWIPGLAAAIGAPPPRHVPSWVGRLAAGDVAVALMTSTRGASNARARRVLGWTPRWPSWREGFREAL
ncbi:MAG: NAD(P)-dependent oxidoreductase, partial [Conexibacter sp.]|nr:NAD(P)-dependent oxidoreductase [Conexibacter sp.]